MERGDQRDRSDDGTDPSEWAGARLVAVPLAPGGLGAMPLSIPLVPTLPRLSFLK